MTDLHYRSATAIAAAIRDGGLSAAEALEHFLDRVRRHNPKLNAIVHLCEERARERARAADAAQARGLSLGPLHGVPMTVKESYEVAGTPTTWGNPAWRDNVTQSTAVAIARLEAAGAVLFGKTNVPLFLADWQSFNAIYGTTGNPWDLGRSPGGSSGGSAAALAAGLTGLDAGSDIGASIRNPAHYCGVYGHKPTWGVIPGEGHRTPVSSAPPDLAVVGPLARSAGDLELAFGLMAGPVSPQSRAWRLALPAARAGRLADLRVAVWLDEAIAPVDRRVTDRIQAVADRLGRLGARVDDRARPGFDAAEYHRVYIRLLRGQTASRQPEEAFRRFLAQADASDPADDSYNAQNARASTQRHRDWAAADELRHRYRRQWDAFFRDWDVLLCPTAATPAFPHDHSDRSVRTLEVDGRRVDFNGQLFWAGLTTTCFLPSTVAPAGLTPDGLPVGVQIAGAEFDDLTTLRVARLLADEIGGFVPPPGWD